MLYNLVSLLGIVGIIGIAWLMSNNKKAFPWRQVLWGLGLQFLIAIFVFVLPVGKTLFLWMNDLAVTLIGYATEGGKFVFGGLATRSMATKEGAAPGSDFVFAFEVLTTVIFFSSLIGVLYYIKVMQVLVKAFAWVMQKTMKVSGAEALTASANIFFGQSEAPIAVKPYIPKMTQSEIMSMMTGGFATVAGGVMAAYIGMLHEVFPNIAGHLISASVLSAPAALMLAKVVFPETEKPLTQGEVAMNVETEDVNVLDAAATGAASGLHLALNIGAMLIAFMALLAMINAIIGYFGSMLGIDSLSLQKILGWTHYPIALMMGVYPQDAMTVATLLGEKLILTEFVGYLNLTHILKEGVIQLHPRSVVIVTYGLCGFANFASIAIQIGGIRAIAPSRSSDLAKLGLKAMFTGALAAYLTGNIAGIFFSGNTIL
ncbi:MAG TPA: nucleoside transporter C-terminal domain-containing protein [Oligoflexia bacterium]|nr:nucleoside transporter C-terminal domain-containing protein [Oligoflexia bacterium]HMR23853.1 nucleoside transporter C-terminal domain-containing protein [Oligoflexia bacterium]